MTKDDLKEKAALEETAGDQPSEDDETDAEEASLTETNEEIRALEEKLAEVETKLAEAEKITAEYLDGWQRAQAAFANFRKRTEAEQSEWTSRANARLLSRILPVLDDFKRAFETVPEKYKDDDWIKGLHLVERKLKSVLDSENVKAMELSPGDAFDPNLHEAVLYQEVPGFEEGDIVAEIETGYTIGDRILRPALVVVAKGAAAPASAETSVEAEDAEGAAQMPESEVSAEATASPDEGREEAKEPMAEREPDLGDRA